MKHRGFSARRRDTGSRRVVIFGLEVFARKNRLQLETMANFGYTYDVYVHDLSSASAVAFAGLEQLGHRLHVLPFSASGVVRSAFVAVRGRPHHVEFYTTDSRSMVMPVIARAAGVPVVTVERGLISVIDERPRWKRWALAGTYRLSDVVLYKEPHMAPLIKKLASGAELEFVPNAVLPATPTVPFAERDIDFLWANRILDDRYCEWLTDFVAMNPPGHRKTVVAGLRPDASLTPSESAKQVLVRRDPSQNIDLMEWVDPHPLMVRSRFFVMAARYVFGNNALLEAMSMGCVPIVTEAPGIELLVKDGVEGVICEPSRRGLYSALTQALAMTASEWQAMSLAARHRVSEGFSPDALSTGLGKIYSNLCPHRSRHVA